MIYATEKREIRYNEKWYVVGDVIELMQPLLFLFWRLPIKKKVKWKIAFIGNDCSALLTKNSGIKNRDRKTIIGSVNISYAN